MVTTGERNGRRRLFCPFLDKFTDECFPANLTSLRILSVIHYCGGHFEGCEVYKKLSGEIAGIDSHEEHLHDPEVRRHGSHRLGR